MQWYEIDVSLPPPLLESIYNFLWLYVNGLRVERTKDGFLVKAYLFSSSPHKFLKRLNNFMRIMAKSFHVTYSPPVVNTEGGFLTNEFVIVPIPTSCISPYGVPILLQRGKAFGIGSHPCTIYCLQALKDITRGVLGEGQITRILDAGTGTGILAIAAAKLGAEDITAVEICYESVVEAQENVKLNKFMKEIQTISCSVTEVKGQFNLIFANLYDSLLMEIATSLIQQLAPKGWIVLGGMMVPYDEVVISAFAQHGLKKCACYRDEEWSVAVLQKI